MSVAIGLTDNPVPVVDNELRVFIAAVLAAPVHGLLLGIEVA